MKQFTDLGLAEPILRAVTAEGYTTPTPIQAEVIPAMLAGSDLVGIAQTGTGKTAAFTLPLLNAVVANQKRPEPKTCRALILAPTRELVSQIADSVRAYGRFARPSIAVVVGGVKPGPQVRALMPGVDILVATPGRLEDHMRSGAIRLDRTTTIVLDEADQMLDLGFMPAIRRIMAKLPKERQTALLSATMPKEIRSLAEDFLRNPAEIAVTPVSKPVERIDQSVKYVNAAEKRAALVEILSAPAMERAIVFTRTKRGADKVQKYLDEAGLPAAAIHGNKSQGQRERALGAFKKAQVRILVATDIAARGIDIDNVSHVVNFELPDVPESYVHRIGRTARAGKSGIAVALCDPAERGLLRDIERLIGFSLETGEPVAPRGSRPEPRPARREGGEQRGFSNKTSFGKSGDARPAGKSNGKRRRRGGAGQRDGGGFANGPGHQPQATSAPQPGREPRRDAPRDANRDRNRQDQRGREQHGDRAGLSNMLGKIGNGPGRGESRGDNRSRNNGQGRTPGRGNDPRRNDGNRAPAPRA